jgi:ABC-2 type transport system permease protein
VPYYAAREGRTSAVLNATALFNPAGGYATYVLPAVFLLICHQLIIIGISTTMAQERVAASISPLTRLCAKTAVYMLIMVLQLLFLYAVVLPLFKIPFAGALGDILLFLFPFCLAVIFLGIILGSFVKVSETVLPYVAVTSIPLLFMSGFSWLPTSMPWFIQKLRLIFPSTHGIEGVVRIYRQGATLADVLPSVAALWAMTLFFFIVALFRLRKKSGAERVSNAQ